MSNIKQTSRLDRWFGLTANKTSIRTEMTAGLTSFVAVAYILAVNPQILSATGMPAGGVLMATILASFVGTVLMALLANYPFVLAPGMGLNAYFTYTVVLTMGYSWQFALLAVFIEGLLFVLLSCIRVRERLFNAIPMTLKKAVGAGIGLFIAFIALQNSHIIVNNDATLVSMQMFSREAFNTHGISALLTCVGVLLTAALLHRRVPGAILLGILGTWLLGIVAQLTGLYTVSPEAGCFSLIPNLNLKQTADIFPQFASVCGALFNPQHWTLRDSPLTGAALLTSINFIIVIFSFLFVDLFDTLGTLIGVSQRSGFLDKNGHLPNLKGALYADAIATSAGAVFGTSTTTTFVESAAGVTAGGRTGLTALTAAALFLLSILFAPIFLAIPAFATAPALIIVGFYMMSSVADINFSDLPNAIPAYLCILAMPFAYSIAEGISLGVISWTVLSLAAGRARSISPIMYLLTLLFLAKYIFL